MLATPPGRAPAHPFSVRDMAVLPLSGHMTRMLSLLTKKMQFCLVSVPALMAHFFFQGVCATALKRACRKLGVKHWPYRDQQGHTQRTLGATLGTSAARSDRWPAREASAKRWQKKQLFLFLWLFGVVCLLCVCVCVCAFLVCFESGGCKHACLLKVRE